jgi:hypothetical protein
MTLYPWVQMVLRELAAPGPSPEHAEPLPGSTGAAFREMAAKRLTRQRWRRSFENLEETMTVVEYHPAAT